MARPHAGRLADGREIIYYDDVERAREPSPDPRELPPRPRTPDLRRDPLTGEWVAIAAARADRVFLPEASADPLAPQSRVPESEVPDDYDVVVFENRTPSFGPAMVPLTSASSLGARGIAAGRCEVVVFSPDSEGSFGTQSAMRARTILGALADRTRVLGQLPSVEQVFPFENRGTDIGVTLPHPHGQIYGYPFITPRTTSTIAQAIAHPGDLFQDILDAERSGDRVVLETPNFTFFVPFAARWPLEVHGLPHCHVPDLAALTDALRDELAVAFLRVIRAVDARFDRPSPYIAAWHQAPVRSHRDLIRLMVQVTSPLRAEDKLKYMAGSEAAMGAWVNDVTPESQADTLRRLIAATPEPD